jgi:hypothetical protein
MWEDSIHNVGSQYYKVAPNHFFPVSKAKIGKMVFHFMSFEEMSQRH